MKIKEIKNNPYKNIGTVIAYKERSLYPDPENISEIIEDDKSWNDILSQSEIGMIMYPSKIISETLELSLYDFNFNLLMDKDYVPEFMPNLLDDESLELLGEDLDSISPLIVPQVSNSSERVHPKYFGGLQDKNGNQIYLIELPILGNEENKEGFWKVEIYNEKITGNVKKKSESGDSTQKIEGILDYDTYNFLDKIRKGKTKEDPNFKFMEEEYELTHTPCIQIYFGPTYSTKLLGESLEEAKKNLIYATRYLYEITEEEYNSFNNELEELDYVMSYKNEILSKKYLYLVIGQNRIEEINLVDSSFSNLKNPLRNQKELSSRMDDYLSYKINSIKSNKNSFVFDRSSGALLGNIESREFPILEYQKRIAKNSFRTPKIPKVEVNNKTYLKGKSLEIFEDPITSPDWILDRKIGSNYIKTFVTSTPGGTLSPGGSCYFKKGNQLKISQVPDTGFNLTRVEELFNENPEPVIIGGGESEYTFGGVDEEGNLIPVPELIKFVYEEIPCYFELLFINTNNDTYTLNRESIDSWESGDPYITRILFKTADNNWTDILIPDFFSITKNTDITFKFDWDWENGAYLLDKAPYGALGRNELLENSDGSYTVSLTNPENNLNENSISNIIFPIKLKNFTVLVSSSAVDIQIENSRLESEYNGEVSTRYSIGSPENSRIISVGIDDNDHPIEFMEEDTEGLEEYKIRIVGSGSDNIKRLVISDIKHNYNIKIYEV